MFKPEYFQHIAAYSEISCIHIGMGAVNSNIIFNYISYYLFIYVFRCKPLYGVKNQGMMGNYKVCLFVFCLPDCIKINIQCNQNSCDFPVQITDQKAAVIPGKRHIFFKKLVEIICNFFKKHFFWWAHQDSDLGPPHYECAALTS